MTDVPGRPVAVVTGGARRLGRHLCLALAADGYDIVCIYRSSVDAARSLEQEITASGGRVRTVQLDVSIRRLVRRSPGSPPLKAASICW